MLLNKNDFNTTLNGETGKFQVIIRQKFVYSTQWPIISFGPSQFLLNKNVPPRMYNINIYIYIDIDIYVYVVQYIYV